MKALLVPEARMIIVSLGADGAPGYTFLRLDDWIAAPKLVATPRWRKSS